MKSQVIILYVIVAALLAFTIWTKLSQQKIAFVRSAVVVDQYLGVKDSRKVMEGKLGEWQANIDTLSFALDKSIKNYEQDFNKLNSAEKMQRQALINSQKERLEQYKSALERKAMEENEVVMQGSLNQINSYIKKYSEEHGYDVVIGVTTSGNLLYGKDAIDITDEILEGVNKEYKK